MSAPQRSLTEPAAELTHDSYGDTWWGSVPITVVSSRDPQYGENGYFLRALERQSGSLNGRSVLEIGGALSHRLAAIARYRRVEASIVDYSKAGVDASQRFFDAYGCQVEPIHSDVFALSGRSFDVVTHWGVLEHELDPAPLLAKCVELARQAVIFTMPDIRGPSGWMWKKLAPENYARHVYHTDVSVLATFAALGWKAKAFSWGQPFLYMQTGNDRCLLRSSLYKLQAAIDKPACMGLPYDRGVKYLPQNRGFIANPIT